MNRSSVPGKELPPESEPEALAELFGIAIIGQRLRLKETKTTFVGRVVCTVPFAHSSRWVAPFVRGL
jgi:hypothetical protein